MINVSQQGFGLVSMDYIFDNAYYVLDYSRLTIHGIELSTNM